MNAGAKKWVFILLFAIGLPLAAIRFSVAVEVSFFLGFLMTLPLMFWVVWLSNELFRGDRDA